jgi:hypothetical protein
MWSIYDRGIIVMAALRNGILTLLEGSWTDFTEEITYVPVLEG